MLCYSLVFNTTGSFMKVMTSRLKILKTCIKDGFKVFRFRNTVLKQVKQMNVLPNASNPNAEF